MICCGKDMGHGNPYVVTQYWCDTCKTEHLVNAVELTEYIAKLNAEKDAASGKLPSLL